MILKKLLYCIYPTKCISCGKIIGVNDSICTECNDIYKPRPASKIGSKYLTSCAYTFYHEGNIKKAIWRFKFRSKLYYADPFTDYMLDCFNEYYFNSCIDYLVPVPMNKKKKRYRGYNQTEVLAKYLSKKCGVPYLKDGLIKVKENKDQHGMTLSERRINIKGVYGVNKHIDFRGKRVIIIDDVLTTGLTMYECAKMLKKSGAESVYGITIAAASDKSLVDYR